MLGFGVYGLGFRVWGEGLGFGVWGWDWAAVTLSTPALLQGRALSPKTEAPKPPTP